MKNGFSLSQMDEISKRFILSVLSNPFAQENENLFLPHYL